MFAFLKRKPKVLAYIPEPTHFVGKSPADNEFIQFGGNDTFVIFINCYLRELHQQLINKTEGKIKNVPSCHFLVVDNEKSDMLVGLLGPSVDKSHRENVFLLSRHIMNDFIKKYPLFIPSLYDEFYLQSHRLLNEQAFQLSLPAFQRAVSQLNVTSVYRDKSQTLNASIDNLCSVSIYTYLDSLSQQGIHLSQQELMGIWFRWRQKVCQSNDKGSLLPLKIELPSDDNLNYYVAFVCQIIEPLFNNKPYYRVIWWRDKQSQQAWCFITEQRIDPTTDLIFFNVVSNQTALCLQHEKPIVDIKFETVDSLLDALQVITK